MNKGRYFLFDVPSGVSDLVIKQSLGELINYPEGILGLNWIEGATSAGGGILKLSLDSKAVQLIKTRSNYLYVDAKPVIFVDKKELVTKVTSTIDDDVLTVVKQEMPSEKFEMLIDKLKMTNFQHEEGYDCWRIEGSFHDVKAFEVGVRNALFPKGDDFSQATSSSEKPKSKQKKKKSRVSELAKAIESSKEETVRSGDEENAAGAETTLISRFHTTFAETDSAVDTLSISRPSSLPIRIEFCVGELCMEKGVNAVVVPTNVHLDHGAGIFSFTLVSAVGSGEYEKFRREKLEELGGFVPCTSCVCMEKVNLPARNVILVIEPQEFSKDVGVSMKDIGECYDNVFQMAKVQRYSSVACPPLGLGKGVEASVAAASAVAAITNAIRRWSPPLPEFLDVFRFVFTNSIAKDIFLAIFHKTLEPSVVESEQRPGTSKMSSVETEGVPVKESTNSKERICSICWTTLDNGLEQQRVDGCGHVHHSVCIQLWYKEKKTCPDCGATAQGFTR